MLVQETLQHAAYCTSLNTDSQYVQRSLFTEHRVWVKGKGRVERERSGVSKMRKREWICSNQKQNLKKLLCLPQYLRYLLCANCIFPLFYTSSKPFVRWCWEINLMYYKASERCRNLIINVCHSGSSDPGLKKKKIDPGLYMYLGQGHCVSHCCVLW